MKINISKQFKSRALVGLIVAILLLISVITFTIRLTKSGNETKTPKSQPALMHNHDNTEQSLDPEPNGGSDHKQNDIPNDPYTEWKTYKNPTFNYTIRYPQDWSKIQETAQAAFVTFSPNEKPDAVISAAIVKTSAPPNKLLDLSKRTIFDSNQSPINSYETYYVKYGDSTYINRTYLISHSGMLVKTSITEMSQNPKIDNSKYLSQFDLIAKSLKF